MKQVLVIGASGNIGRHVVAQLPAESVGIRALVRNPDAARMPEHVEVVRGDLTVPETLDAPLDGVDAVFLLWMAPPATVVPALERITKQAKRIVFLSSPHKTQHPLFQRPQPNLISALHRQIEQLMESSGREWTFLRPHMLASNALLWWAPQIRAGEVVRWPYAAATTVPIDERDIAAVAVRALCEEGHAGKEYLITGPEPLSHVQQVETIARALGRALRYEELTPDEARRELLPIMIAPVINMLLAAWEGTLEAPALVTSTVADVTGAPARTFLQWARDHAAEFRN